MDQNHHETIQISRLFQGEINITVKGVGTYQIYEDQRHQLLNLFSPKTGFYCFDWKRPQNKWVDISNDQFLNGCLQAEFNNIPSIEGFLNY